jgi:hypothetical protein
MSNSSLDIYKFFDIYEMNSFFHLRRSTSGSTPFSSRGRLHRECKCCICYEIFPSGENNAVSSSFNYTLEGIFCNNCHFICNNDLQQVTIFLVSFIPS